MASESWKVLARRLGKKSHINYFRGPANLCESEIESLLVGETLRVAWELNQSVTRKWSECEQIIEMFLSVATSSGDARATACLSLLDAVGHKGEQSGERGSR